jgi:UDP-N-acetylmuramoylalanine--D-glutamate ligase
VVDRLAGRDDWYCFGVGVMDYLRGKRLVILGLARQGKALARFAVQAGAEVVVSDLRPAESLAGAMDELADCELEMVLGEHPEQMLAGADLLAVSGGVPTDAPIVQSACRQGIPLTNDSLEFIRRTPATVLGITGSAGKSTTTALTGMMAKMAGRRTWVGGNIGAPLISLVDQMEAGDLAVQELSSFQLELWTQSPPVAAVLNITPNHLDRHRTMAAYTQAKANILRYQGPGGVAVLCADDPGAMALAAVAPGRVRSFSMNAPVADGAFLGAGEIQLQAPGSVPVSVCPAREIRLRGRHNVANILAAVTLAASVGIPTEAMRQAIQTFTGIEHRLEEVATINGVLYVNDSIATAPERTLAALAAFDSPVVLLAGGQDKNLDWQDWGKSVPKNVHKTVLFGALGPHLAELLAQSAEEKDFTLVDTMEAAIQVAATIARPGDVVLLSPGGTSFDAYPDFAARGTVFREIVMAMQEV